MGEHLNYRTDLIRGLESLVKNEAGETLFSFLVGLFLSSIMFAGVMTTFMSATQSSEDHKLMLEAQQEARTIADLMAFELRLSGAGVPFTQANFQIGGTGLSDAPLPILLDATADSVSFRRNEKGKTTVLSASFDPSTTQQFSVLEGDIFSVGDTVYISDMLAGGSSGLQGEVSAVSGNSITIDSDFIASAGASFASGSLVEPVTLITYSISDSDDAITRDPETGESVLSPRSQFALEYVDSNGDPLSLPLTYDVVRDSLTGVNITVSVDSPRALTNGQIYTAQVNQTAAFRNLIFSR